MAIYTIPASAAGVQLVGGLGTRKRLIIENGAPARLYCRIGRGTASLSSYSFSLAQNENMTLDDCTARVTGIWIDEGGGSAHITEY